MHNLYFILALMARVRGALADGTYAALKDEVLGGLRSKRAPVVEA
jgi:queuine/archaeosine tRNA-ribosyltransferase